MTIRELDTWFWHLGTLLRLVLLVRVLGLGLGGRYPALVICLAAQTVRTVLLLPFQPNQNSYAIIYLVTEPLLLVTFVLATLEVISKVFESYRGLKFLGRRTLLAAVGVSAVLSVVTHLAEFRMPLGRFPWLRAELLLETFVYSAMLILLAAMAGFLAWYPMPVRKNVLLYGIEFFVLFAAMAGGVLLRNLEEGALAVSGLVRTVAMTVCFGSWAVLMRKSWEEERRPGAVGADSGKLLRNLESLNQILERPKGGA